jgi:hypothetical protein
VLVAAALLVSGASGHRAESVALSSSPCNSSRQLQDDYQVLIDAVNGEQVDPSTALQNVEAYHASGGSGTATGG